MLMKEVGDVRGIMDITTTIMGEVVGTEGATGDRHLHTTDEGVTRDPGHAPIHHVGIRRWTSKGCYNCFTLVVKRTSILMLSRFSCHSRAMKPLYFNKGYVFYVIVILKMTSLKCENCVYLYLM